MSNVLYSKKPEYEYINISECFDTEYYDELVLYINSLEINEEIKMLLLYSASRYVNFNYEKIAKVYSCVDNTHLRQLFQELSLVIPEIDCMYNEEMCTSGQEEKDILLFDYLNNIVADEEDEGENNE